MGKGTMSRRGPGALAVVTIAIGVLLASGGLASNVRAQTAPDRSEVVIVLDFSASILQDAANRNKFGAALERIADRVDATSADLIAGDAVVTIVQFATRASDYAGCADMHLLASAPTVARFADCLRLIARAYRRGLDPALTRRIGVDTNYVAAMEQAAKHLPADAARPALILFTDGKHDVRGVPVSRVPVVRDQLFGRRSPFALLPVGMGLNPRELGALETGLVRLRIVRAMPPCVSGTKFDWPDVVFESPDEAGNAVGVALQDVTCTFTVEPSPTPPPTPAPSPAVAQGIRLTARADHGLPDPLPRGGRRLDRVEGGRIPRYQGHRRWTHERDGLSVRSRHGQCVVRRGVDARLVDDHPTGNPGGTGKAIGPADGRCRADQCHPRRPGPGRRIPLPMLER
jgi:hypothetical protein